MKILAKFWFLIALASVLTMAYFASGRIASVEGIVRPVRTACIVGIFLISGLTLPTQMLRTSIGHWRMHFFVQGFNLMLIPVLFAVLRPLLLRSGMERVLADGFIILACMPTTVASSVAMTAMAGGNEAGALCNSTLGNLLGIVVSPLLVYLLLSLRGTLEWLDVVRNMFFLVVAPALAGQLCRMIFKQRIENVRRNLAVLSQLLLLVVIFSVFNATFTLDVPLPQGSLAVVALIVMFSHSLLLALNWRLSALPLWRMARADRIAALMCGTQKTVALGIPLITVLYDNASVAGLISIPLLCYHPLQLLTGTMLAVILRKPVASFSAR